MVSEILPSVCNPCRQQVFLPHLETWTCIAEECAETEAFVMSGRPPVNICCRCPVVHDAEWADSGEICCHEGCDEIVDACCIACTAALCVKHFWGAGDTEISRCHDHNPTTKCPCQECVGARRNFSNCPRCTAAAAISARLCLSEQRLFGRCLWIPGCLHILHGACEDITKSMTYFSSTMKKTVATRTLVFLNISISEKHSWTLVLLGTGKLFAKSSSIGVARLSPSGGGARCCKS